MTRVTRDARVVTSDGATDTGDVTLRTRAGAPPFPCVHAADPVIGSAALGETFPFGDGRANSWKNSLTRNCEGYGRAWTLGRFNVHGHASA